MVVIALASDSTEAASLWSRLTCRLVPESISNERAERVCALMTVRCVCV